MESPGVSQLERSRSPMKTCPAVMVTDITMMQLQVASLGLTITKVTHLCWDVVSSGD